MRSPLEQPKGDMKHRTATFPKELNDIKLIQDPKTVLDRLGLSPITVRRLAREAQPIERTSTTRGEFIPNAKSYRLIGTVIKEVYSTEATTVEDHYHPVFYDILPVQGWIRGINKEGVTV